MGDPLDGSCSGKIYLSAEKAHECVAKLEKTGDKIFSVKETCHNISDGLPPRVIQCYHEVIGGKPAGKKGFLKDAVKDMKVRSEVLKTAPETKPKGSLWNRFLCNVRCLNHAFYGKYDEVKNTCECSGETRPISKL